MHQTIKFPECPECGKEIKGRLDKKFCDDFCRNAFNNKARRPHELMIKNTNSQIRRNRRILKILCPSGKATVRREILINMGFDFSFFTSIYSGKGQVYYISYDFAFTPIIENKKYSGEKLEKVLIVQRQEYMAAKNFNPWSYLKP